jgi:hypothetical protein
LRSSLLVGTAPVAVLVTEKRCSMRKVLFVAVLGTVALLGLPGMSSAQHHGMMHGGMMHGGFRPGFGPRMFDHRVNRFHPDFDRGRFEPRFNRFDRDFDRFHRDFDRRMFDPRFNRGIFDPRFSPGFRPVLPFPF